MSRILQTIATVFYPKFTCHLVEAHADMSLERLCDILIFKNHKQKYTRSKKMWPKWHYLGSSFQPDEFRSLMRLLFWSSISSPTGVDGGRNQNKANQGGAGRTGSQGGAGDHHTEADETKDTHSGMEDHSTKADNHQGNTDKTEDFQGGSGGTGDHHGGAGGAGRAGDPYGLTEDIQNGTVDHHCRADDITFRQTVWPETIWIADWFKTTWIGDWLDAAWIADWFETIWRACWLAGIWSTGWLEII